MSIRNSTVTHSERETFQNGINSVKKKIPLNKKKLPLNKKRMCNPRTRFSAVLKVTYTGTVGRIGDVLGGLCWRLVENASGYTGSPYVPTCRHAFRALEQLYFGGGSCERCPHLASFRYYRYARSYVCGLMYVPEQKRQKARKKK